MSQAILTQRSSGWVQRDPMTAAGSSNLRLHLQSRRKPAHETLEAPANTDGVHTAVGITANGHRFIASTFAVYSQDGVPAAQRAEFLRADGACLEGRNYSVN
jgi:hypothetical protein